MDFRFIRRKEALLKFLTLKNILALTVVSVFIIFLGANVGYYAVSNNFGKFSIRSAVTYFAPIIQRSIANDKILIANGAQYTLSSAEMRTWTESYLRQYSKKNDLRLNHEKIRDYLAQLAPAINQPVIDARFQFVGDRAEIFAPASPGQELEIDESVDLVVRAILAEKNEVVLSIKVIEPAITLDKINSLGINTLIGRGESSFVGSHLTRIQNIKVGSAKFNGILVGSGETFSFNSLLGEVDAKNGYVAEQVIKGGKVIYEYGGGLCQVSTTLFRAAIYAGFPIVERRPHSFAVRYYNPQGFDSTIYPGVTDLKFINDTEKSILIQSRIVGTNLIFEIYGTDDGRKVTIDGPHTYDVQTNGAMKAYFTRTISYLGQPENKQTFYSVYRPSSAYVVERNPLE